MKISLFPVRLRFVCFGFLLFFIVLGVFNDSHAQSFVKIDSLQEIIKKTTGKERIDARIELSVLYLNGEIPKGLNPINDAYKEAMQLGDSARMVRAGRFKGQILGRSGDFSKSIALLSEVLPIAKRNGLNKDYKFILNGIGLGYLFKADYSAALKYLLESLVLREKDGDKKEISIAINNIGLVYYKLENWKKAIEYYNRSLEMKRQAHDNYDLDRLLINIGLSYNGLHEYSKAQEYINEGLSLCKVNCNEQIITEGKFGLGHSFFNLNDFDKAEEYFLSSLLYARRVGDKRFEIENLCYLSLISSNRGNFQVALSRLKDAQIIAKDLEIKELMLDIYKDYYEVFHKMKDFKNETIFKYKYVHLKDSLYTRSMLSSVSRFEDPDHAGTLADRDKELKLKESILYHQRNQIILLITITLFIFILISILLISKRKNKRISS